MAKIDIVKGDVRDVCALTVPDFYHMAVTSPPYFGLRNYETDPQAWGDGWRGELGAEPTPEQYVAHLVECFSHVKRVLRPDGVLFLVIGDSYNGSGGAGGDHNKGGLREACAKYPGRKVPGLKPKDLVGIPWMVAQALRADCWYLRQEIIWFKPNPRPQPYRDKCIHSHESILVLTKSKNYYWDWLGLKELIKKDPYQPFNTPKSVWIIPAPNYGGNHFATFPERLVERCVTAGTSEYGVCPECGAPFERLVEKGEPDHAARAKCGADKSGEYRGQGKKDYEKAGAENPSDLKRKVLAGLREEITVGWVPTCRCEDEINSDLSNMEPAAATVFDPFFGAGTTGIVAARMGRDTVGIELKQDYVNQAHQRAIEKVPGATVLTYGGSSCQGRQQYPGEEGVKYAEAGS